MNYLGASKSERTILNPDYYSGLAHWTAHWMPLIQWNSLKIQIQVTCWMELTLFKYLKDDTM